MSEPHPTAMTRELGEPEHQLASKKLLTLTEVAEYLRVSPATVRRWTNTGKLLCYRPGGRNSWRRFAPEEVLAFLARNKQGLQA